VKEKDARKDRIYADPLSKVGGFVFDESVAHVFDDMIRRSVPCYAMTLSLMPLIAQRYAQKNSTIYDLGCSLGAGLAAIARSLPQGTSLVGVDNSQSMLNRCQIESARRYSRKKKWSLECSDILDLDITNASVVILNFTLQFIPLESRLPLLSRSQRAWSRVAYYSCQKNSLRRREYSAGPNRPPPRFQKSKWLQRSRG